MMNLCFTGVPMTTQRNLPIFQVSRKSPNRVSITSMKVMSTGSISLYGGVGILSAVLVNRLIFTPLDALAQAQSRSDILGVIAGATLVLYGVGKAEISDSKQAVELSGVDVRKGFEVISGSQLGYEVEWAAASLLSAIPNVKSCAIFVNGVGRFFLGRFRVSEVEASVIPDGVLELAMGKGERAYLADMKTVPVKDVEFGFLPSNCQVGRHQSLQFPLVMIATSGDAGKGAGTLQASTVERVKLKPSRDLLCGALAGCCARMMVAPLDVLKIRFQVQAETRGLYRYASMTSALRSIVAREGLRALWKGNVPALMMVTPYASLQLAAFYQLKQSQLIDIPEPYASLTMGAISGAVATVFTYPMDLLRTRFAAQSEPKLYHSMRHAVEVIYGVHGFRGFYAGLQPTLLEIVPYISLHFAFYEGLKGEVLKWTNSEHLRARESLLVGAATGTASKLLTLPLDNAKKLMQVEGQFQTVDHPAPRYRGMGHVLRAIWRREGIRGWFRGTSPSLAKAAPNSAITFAVYEAAKRYFAHSG